VSIERTFTKLQGCGNDYLFVDCLEQPLEDAAEVARLVSDRRRGLGSDGIICIYPSSTADFRMEMYNADGSRGEMCGNGIRGLAKYVADRGLSGKHELAVETDAGRRRMWLTRADGRVTVVRVDMGMPILEGRKIPVDADGTIVDYPLDVAGRRWTVTCVSMGNPHCVTFDADPGALDLAAVGPEFENHPFFPARVNTEFIRCESAERLVMRVWERGSGETMACGTGACAAVVAGVLTGRCSRRSVVCLRGGELEIEYQEDGSVMMTGPSVEVFSASVRLERHDRRLTLGS